MANTDEGVGLFLGLLALSVFANWAELFEPNDDREVSFGGIFKMALGALVLTAIGTAITDGDPPDVIFIAAGIGAIASFVIQAGTSWMAWKSSSLNSSVRRVRFTCAPARKRATRCQKSSSSPNSGRPRSSGGSRPSS